MESITRLSLAHTALCNEIAGATTQVRIGRIPEDHLTSYLDARSGALKILYRLREEGFDYIHDRLLEELIQNLFIHVGERKCLEWVLHCMRSSQVIPLREFTPPCGEEG